MGAINKAAPAILSESKENKTMKTLTIEQLTIPYEKTTLLQWKKRDPSVVPSFMLAWNGPGISNGYGFGEWMAEKHFRDKGYYTITDEFNLLSKSSKFKRYNDIIHLMSDHQRLKRFKSAARLSGAEGCTIENPDMFVYDLEHSFFAEVKKERDLLREPQIRFMFLAQSILGIESKLVYLSDSETVPSQKIIEVQVDLPDLNVTT